MNKKITVFILTISALISGLSSACAAETWYTGAWSGLNCRQEPSTEADVLTVYPRGTELQIIGVDETGKWWETWDGTYQGWCHCDYLKPDKPSELGECLGTFKITGYTSAPSENGGYTTTCYGESLSANVGKIVAVDPNVIPHGRTIYIDGIGYRRTADSGVYGRVIDVLTSSNAESYAITGEYTVWLVE